MATPIPITKGMTIGGTNAPSMNGRANVTVLLVIRVVMACSDSTVDSMIEMDCGDGPHTRVSGLLGWRCARHFLFGRRHRLTSG
jgi:hypothetical protein